MKETRESRGGCSRRAGEAAGRRTAGREGGVGKRFIAHPKIFGQSKQVHICLHFPESETVGLGSGRKKPMFLLEQ